MATGDVFHYSGSHTAGPPIEWADRWNHDQFNGYGNHEPFIDTSSVMRELTLLRSQVQTVIEQLHTVRKQLDELNQEKEFYRIKADALQKELDRLQKSS